MVNGLHHGAGKGYQGSKSQVLASFIGFFGGNKRGLTTPVDSFFNNNSISTLDPVSAGFPA
jgi:hypothetical protein